MESIFAKLNAINVNDKVEKKNGLTYLSWAWAWAEVKKLCPDATYTIYERPDGVIYWTDGRTCWVKTGLTINGLEHIEYLPVMDTRNRSIPLEAVTSFDINKAIQRSLTKAAARHGLGLYIYAGEDLPEEEGSKEAAQITGQQKLKRMEKAAPEPEQKMATPEQRQAIMENIILFSDDEVQRMNERFGGSLEKLSFADAAKILKQIDKRAIA